MGDSHHQPAFVAPEPADLAPLFPGYEIQSLIAVGGMGAVYCALQRSLDRTVALKILPMEFSQDSEFCAGFEAEAKAMARLNHPNLVGVYDFGSVSGMLYIIMEFVPGQSVYHAAYGTAIEPKEVILLVSGICEGLAHAHENGITHRDIKPSNILLDLNAQPKIGDFGLARPTNHKAKEGEEIFGTPHYTAPEVVNAPQSVDHRADIFSVGVMLHELLTAKLPENDPRSASMIVGCDARFDAIVRKATMPVAAARYFSIRDIAKDLQAIVEPLTQKSPVMPPGAPSRTAAPGASRRAAPARRYVPVKKKSSGLPMVLLLLVAAAGAYFYFTNKPVKVALQTLSDSVIDTREPIKIEKATSMEIKGAGNLELVCVRFSWQGNQGVLLWKSEPGVQLQTNEDSTLKSLSGHKLQFDTLTKVNYVNSDFNVSSIETNIPYSEDPHGYNRPAITGILPVIRQ